MTYSSSNRPEWDTAETVAVPTVPPQSDHRGDEEPEDFIIDVEAVDSEDPEDLREAPPSRPGPAEKTRPESPAYEFLVGSGRTVQVGAEAMSAARSVGRSAGAAGRYAADPNAGDPSTGDPYAAEVIGREAPAEPELPGELPAYSDRLPHLSVPDIELDGAEHGSLVLRAASLRGAAARRASMPRRDAVRLARIGDGDHALLVLVVADGVPSGEFSQVGAHYACSTLVEAVAAIHTEVVELLSDATVATYTSAAGAAGTGSELRLREYAREAVRRTAEQLGKLARMADLPAEQCSTRFRCTLVPVDRRIRHRLMFSVGSGGFVRLRRGEWQPLAVSVDDESVALPAAWDELVVLVEEGRPEDLLITCTDGVSDLLPAPGVAERLAEQWGAGRAPGPVEFLHQLQLCVPPFDDDRTAVCLWELPEG